MSDLGSTKNQKMDFNQVALQQNHSSTIRVAILTYFTQYFLDSATLFFICFPCCP